MLNFFKKIFYKNTEDFLEILPDGVILLNLKGEFVWYNKIAKEILEDLLPEFAQLTINHIFENGLEQIYKVIDKPNSTIIRTKQSLNKDVFFDFKAINTKTNILVSMRDNTQNYKTLTSILVEHESSKKINRDKNNFLVKLSAEFKTPLQSIIGFSQAMLDGLGGQMSAKQEKYTKIINKNSVDLIYFIDKIIELSKTESNLLQHDFHIFDAVNTIQTIIKINEAEYKEKNLQIELDIDDNLKRMVYSNENLLKIILQNIFESAIKSTDVGIINIEVTHPDMTLINQMCLVSYEGMNEKSFIKFSITDSGIGISETELENIFEPYAQLDNPNRKNLIRSIAFASIRNVIKLLKGNMWIDTEAMKGTIYNVIIPIEKVVQTNNE